jgi:predicted cupin superfamily sugar epimerase
MTSAQEIIAKLKLERHPEGGWYNQTFKDERAVNGRACSTAIFYLLEGGERSHWHKVDAIEIWHYYAGAPLTLRLCNDDKTVRTLTIGPDVLAGQTPQGIVRKDEWQSAESLGDWTLVGCTVAPGFDFAGFTMAEPGWEPG